MHDEHTHDGSSFHSDPQFHMNDILCIVKMFQDTTALIIPLNPSILSSCSCHARGAVLGLQLDATHVH